MAEYQNEDSQVQDLQSELSDLFGELVTVEIVTKKSIAGASIVVCDMAYSKRSSDRTTRVRQTAIVLLADDLNLPEFALSPSATGLAGMLFATFGGFGDINFSDSPEFSKQYHLHGWVEEPVRVLFNSAVRDHFAAEPGWNVRGKANRLVIFRYQQKCAAEELDSFIKSSLPIFELFQAAERELDRRPELRRTAEASDLMATADRIGGFVGSRLKSQLRGLMVTSAELKQFEAAPTPRKIPAAIKRQVLGANLPLVFIGLLFVIAGIGVGATVLLAMQGPLRWMGIPMMLFMPLIGVVVSVWTLLYRRKKARVLQDGALTKGRIISVQATETSINNQIRHRVKIEFADPSFHQSATCTAYGIAADKARELETSGAEVNVLVDPVDPTHIVCTHLLMITD